MGKPSHKPANNRQAPPAGGPRPSLRIILVGRTGLDGRLRLDQGIELARVKTALEAVGELSQHLEEFAARAVVVAADADPGSAAFNGSPADAGRAPEFIEALRRVDPAVRVLRLEGEDGQAPIRAGYDGIVAADADAQVLRAIISDRDRIEESNGRKPPEAPVPAPKTPPAAPPGVPAAPPLPDLPPSPIPVFPPTIEPEPDEEPDEEPAEPALPPATRSQASRGEGEPMKVPAMAEAGDEILVRLLLQGRDITDAAMQILRSRLGSHDVMFTTAGRTGRDAPAERAEEGLDISVSWRGRQYGRLRSKDLGLEGLAPHAAWLGSWLALRDQHAQLREAAFSDSLTGAHNRRFFDHFLMSAIEQAREERRSLTVLMFDIDDFKQYNDRYGHAAGDEILVEIVKLLRSVIRPSDKVCRIGGDEFVVIFHEPTGPRSPTSKHPSDICQIADRFQKAVAEHRFPKLGREAPGTLTISGGLATYPWDGDTPERLLDRADQLALQSKKQGKNCIALGPGAEREHGAK